MGTQSISVEHDIAAVTVFLNDIATQAVKKAVAAAMRRTFTTLKSEVGKEIQRRKLVSTRTLPIRKIKERYIRDKASIAWNMPIDQMEARLDFSKRKPSIMHFWAKRIPVYRTSKSGRGKTRAKGFGDNKLSSVQVTVMGKTYIVKNAFMPGSTGTRTVFVRQTVKRTPIRTVWGPSFATMFEKLDITASLQRTAQERYGSEFGRQFQFYLKQLTDRQAAKAAKE